jgi:hypothetical protein
MKDEDFEVEGEGYDFYTVIVTFSDLALSSEGLLSSGQSCLFWTVGSVR